MQGLFLASKRTKSLKPTSKSAINPLSKVKELVTLGHFSQRLKFQAIRSAITARGILPPACRFTSRLGMGWVATNLAYRQKDWGRNREPKWPWVEPLETVREGAFTLTAKQIRPKLHTVLKFYKMLEDQIKDLQAMVNLEPSDEELSDEELAGIAGGATRGTGTTVPPRLPNRPRR